MSKQLPVILDGELVVPFSQLTPHESAFFGVILEEKDIRLIQLASKALEKTIPYAIYTYWTDYLKLSQDEPNPMQEV